MKRYLPTAAAVLVCMLIIVFAFRLSEAGTLAPTSPPAGSMRSLNEIYDALVGTTYDSSAVVASRSGNALEISKCIIQKITGGTPCP